MRTVGNITPPEGLLLVHRPERVPKNPKRQFAWLERTNQTTLSHFIIDIMDDMLEKLDSRKRIVQNGHTSTVHIGIRDGPTLHDLLDKPTLENRARTFWER